jgi:hypothetical protein
VAVAGEQPHALGLALDDQPLAVVLDFVDPLGTVRDLSRLGGNAGLNFGHARYLGSLVPNGPRDVRANCRAGLDLDLNRWPELPGKHSAT